ncbi:LOW QUALITY PROTEIN: uncharacterized protein LOC132588569 [Heteronotia binoei]|uniref:LOW QUALITY PROTEIN: uncharacterized protein LOC132588569 n=1 Tax=Heteronotia binoei TaxID=13085 RepID=UPI002931143C|nr:LOW QUALITY PROTEIN: uncharacterized protein LOC132588569 [Heteronotia binoei]
MPPDRRAAPLGLLLASSFCCCCRPLPAPVGPPEVPDLQCYTDYATQVVCHWDVTNTTDCGREFQLRGRNDDGSQLECVLENRRLPESASASCVCIINETIFVGVTYCFSLCSAAVSPLKAVKPRAPTNLAVTKSQAKKSFTLTWEDSSSLFPSPVKYEIQISADGEKQPVDLAERTDRYELHTDRLLAGKNYTARIRYQLKEWRSLWSDWSSPCSWRNDFEPEPGDQLWQFVLLVCFLVLVLVSTCYCCFARLKRHYWDQIPSPKIVDDLGRKPCPVPWQMLPGEERKAPLCATSPDLLERSFMGSLPKDGMASLGRPDKEAQMVPWGKWEAVLTPEVPPVEPSLTICSPAAGPSTQMEEEEEDRSVPRHHDALVDLFVDLLGGGDCREEAENPKPVGEEPLPPAGVPQPALGSLSLLGEMSRKSLGGSSESGCQNTVIATSSQAPSPAPEEHRGGDDGQSFSSSQYKRLLSPPPPADPQAPPPSCYKSFSSLGGWPTAPSHQPWGPQQDFPSWPLSHKAAAPFCPLQQDGAASWNTPATGEAYLPGYRPFRPASQDPRSLGTGSPDNLPLLAASGSAPKEGPPEAEREPLPWAFSRCLLEEEEGEDCGQEGARQQTGASRPRCPWPLCDWSRTEHEVVCSRALCAQPAAGSSLGKQLRNLEVGHEGGRRQPVPLPHQLGRSWYGSLFQSVPWALPLPPAPWTAVGVVQRRRRLARQPASPRRRRRRRMRAQALLVLLLLLCLQRGQGDSACQNLRCFADYIQTLTCIWDTGPGGAPPGGKLHNLTGWWDCGHGGPCAFLPTFSTASHTRYTWTSEQKPPCIFGDTFAVTMTTLTDGGPAIQQECGPFQCHENIKTQPPAKVTATAYPGGYNVSWESGYTAYDYLHGELQYQLRYRLKGRPWHPEGGGMAAGALKPVLQDTPTLWLSAQELEGGVEYVLEVRAGLRDHSHYKGTWSDWSPACSLQTPPRGTAGAPAAAAWVVLTPLLAFSLTITLLAFLCRHSRPWQKLEQLVPSPAPYFQTLYLVHNGDFKKWVGTSSARAPLDASEEESCTALPEVFRMRPKPLLATADPGQTAASLPAFAEESPRSALEQAYAHLLSIHTVTLADACGLQPEDYHCLPGDSSHARLAQLQQHHHGSPLSTSSPPSARHLCCKPLSPGDPGEGLDLDTLDSGFVDSDCGSPPGDWELQGEAATSLPSYVKQLLEDGEDGQPAPGNLPAAAAAVPGCRETAEENSTSRQRLSDLTCWLSPSNHTRGDEFRCSAEGRGEFEENDRYEVFLHDASLGGEAVHPPWTYEPMRNIKCDPPYDFQSNMSGSKCLMEWKMPEAYVVIWRAMQWQLQLRATQVPWEQAETKTVVSGETWMEIDASEFTPGTSYIARARCKTPDSNDAYVSQWSEWSTATEWSTPPGPQRRQQQQQREESLAAFASVSLCLGALLLLLLLTSFYSRIKRCCLASTPSPAAFFLPLYASHNGNFQAWIGIKEQDGSSTYPGKGAWPGLATPRPSEGISQLSSFKRLPEVEQPLEERVCHWLGVPQQQDKVSKDLILQRGEAQAPILPGRAPLRLEGLHAAGEGFPYLPYKNSLLVEQSPPQATEILAPRSKPSCCLGSSPTSPPWVLEERPSRVEGGL